MSRAYSEKISFITFFPLFTNIFTNDHRKTVSFSTNRWAHFLAVLTNVDDEAKELNRKSRPVAYRHDIGDGYYVSVTGDVMCVDIT